MNTISCSRSLASSSLRLGHAEGRGECVCIGRLAALIGASMIAGATSTSAADLGGGSFKDTYVAPIPAYNWNGIYFGLQGDIRGVTPACRGEPLGGRLVNDDGSADLDGAVLGVVGGYNFQAGRWVFGVEGDFKASWFDGNDGGTGGDINGVDAEWMASVRARAGYLVLPNSLFYVTGGAAWLNADGVVLSQPALPAPDATFTGWTVGADIEYMFARQATVRLEYRYTDFDRAVSRYGAAYDLGFEPEVHAVRAGITFLLQ